MSRENGENTLTNHTYNEDHIQESIRSALEKYVICPTGWMPAVSKGSVMGTDEPICLRIVPDSKTWEQSRDTCRKDRGYLVKLETQIQIGSLSLTQCMDDLDLLSFWSGLHEEETKLVWDELRPSVVQPLTDQRGAPGAVKRGWSWNKETFEDIDDSCGMMSLKRNDVSLGRKRRSITKKRAFAKRERRSYKSKIRVKRSKRRSENMTVFKKLTDRWTDGRKRRSPRKKRRIDARFGEGELRFDDRKRRSLAENKGNGGRKRRSDGTKMNLGFGRLGDMDDNLNNPLNLPGDHDPPDTNSPDLLFLQQSGQNARNAYLDQLFKHHRRQQQLKQLQQQHRLNAQKEQNKQINISDTTPSTTVTSTFSLTTKTTRNDDKPVNPHHSARVIVKRSTMTRAHVTTPPTVSASSDANSSSQTSTKVTTSSTSIVQSTQTSPGLRFPATTTPIPVKNMTSTLSLLNTTVDIDSSEIVDNSTSVQDMSAEEKDLAGKRKELPSSKASTTAATSTTTVHTQTVGSSSISKSNTILTSQKDDLTTITNPPKWTADILAPVYNISTVSKTSKQITPSPPLSTASTAKLITTRSSISESLVSTTDPTTPMLLSSNLKTEVTDSDDDDNDVTTLPRTTTVSPKAPASSIGNVATPPPKSEFLQFSNTLFPTSFQTAAATNYIKELVERIGFTKTPTVQHILQAKMNMHECSEKHASVCYKKPIRFLARSSLCGEHWLGHPGVDRCYLINDSPLSFYDARQECLTLGGVMARVDSEFYGNVSALALLYYRARTRTRAFAWVDLLTTEKTKLNGSCAYLDGFTAKAFPCNTFLPSICEKAPRYFLGEDNFRSLIEDDDDDDDVQKLFAVHSIPATLLCPLASSRLDQQVTWVKDGKVIPEIQMRERYRNPFRSRHLRLDLALAQRLGWKSSETTHLSQLQGLYWCQVWQNRPYQRIKSHKFHVIFTDVITLHGVVKTKGIPEYDAALLNYMDAAIGIPVAMAQGLAAINNNIFRKLRRSFPILEEADSFVKHADPESGEVSFYVHLNLKNPVLDDVKDKIVTAYLQRFHELLSTRDADLSEHWNVERPVVGKIRIRRTDACIRDELTDKDTGLTAHFNTAAVGRRVNSRDLCGAVPAGFADCKGDYLTGAFWDSWHIDSNCHQPDNTELFTNPFDSLPKESFMELDKVEIEDSNVIEVMDKLEDILDKADDLTEADIDKCAQVIRRIVEVNPTSEQVGKQLVSTVDKILEVGESAMHKAEMKTKAASTIINNLEKFATKSQLGKKSHTRFVSPNLAIEMWDLRHGMRPVIGLGATVAADWDTPLSQPRILTIRDRSEDMFMTFDVAIELPIGLVTDRMKADVNSTRLSMIIYRKVGLFTSAAPMSNTSHDVINSAIIAASLGGKKIVGLQDNIRMVFRPFKKRTSHFQTTRCVYWDFHRAGWSNQGCSYNGSMYGKEVCVCDHLTNFAILLDFYGQRKPIGPDHELTLSIITLVGLSLSILGLSLTVISFIFFKKLRKGRAQLTLFNMALALVAANLVFLVGIKQTTNDVICLMVSMLLHYLLLVAFMWMLIEAVLQYFTFVKVLGSYISRYTLKTLASAWGLPLIPVITVLSIDYNLYRGRSSYCWLELQAFYYAFALPVGIIIAINIIMFVVVLVSISRRPDGLRNNQSKHNRASTNLKAAITVFVLLGLTWIFGYLAIDNARLVFQYVFTLFSSLQGFFIFILMVARRPQVREHWKAICCKKRNVGTQKKVSPTISNSASSRGSEGSSRSSDTSSRGSDVGLHVNGSLRTLISTNSVSSTCSSVGSTCGNAGFVSSSFVNRAFNSGFDSMYNVHSRRQSMLYHNLYSKPCDIKE